MSQSLATPLVVSVAMDTDIGRERQQNQDAIGHLVPTDPVVLDSLGQIFVLADGVGGLKGGDLASQYAVSTIIGSYYDQAEGDPSDRLARAIAEANNIIYDEGQSQETPATMATTVVVAIVRGRDLIVGSVGDSPAYLIRDAHPRKLTLDHTTQVLQPDSEPPGKLVRALGVAPSVKVDIITGRVRDGDCVVLCSDGLTRYVIPEEIGQMVTSLPILDASKALIEMANERGGADNISVIALRLADENLAQLPPLEDPMRNWGRSRRGERARTQISPGRIGSPAKKPATGPTDNLLRDLWQFLRGNTILTATGMGVLLVIFVIIMLVLNNAGDSDEDRQAEKLAAATRAAQTTMTATFAYGVTAQAAAVQTADAVQAATAAEIARLTLTPPTPIPTSGPQMTDGIWFRVEPGDPVPAFEEPDADSKPATALEAGDSYRVTLVVHETKNGPWYQVVDNLGQEVRWVNGPSLHQRLVAVDPDGNPLPPDQQPLDVPLPGGPVTATSVRATPPLIIGTPGTPGTPPPTIALPGTATRPPIAYGVENWEVDERVMTKDMLDLCRTPDVKTCDMGKIKAGETGIVIEGPVAAGEHWWWKIEFEDESSGWVAQVLLATP